MPRSVPISLDQLITQQSKGKLKDETIDRSHTKYVSKVQREKIEAEKKKRQVEEAKQVRETRKLEAKQVRQVEEPIKARKADKKQSSSLQPKKQFQFEWGNEEDTLGDFEPIIETDDLTNDQLLRKRRKYDDIHWSQKPLDKMTPRDWRIMKEDYNISSKGGKMENPIRYWQEIEIDGLLLKQLERLGYREPTPIQRASIPTGLKNRDVIGIAETGSGKTLAYIIPILNYVLRLPPLAGFEGPYSLILVPTRELALQVEKEFEKFYRHLRFTVASLIGGHSYEENVAKLANGAEIVIATPGRLIDCIERSIVNLEKCYFLVLDEADRMIDMGFEEQVSQILDKLPSGDTNPFYFGEKGGKPQRTTMMFTATMPEAIEKIATASLLDPVTVMVGEIGEAVESVTQIAIKTSMDDDKKLLTLRKILERRNYRPPVIIFANYKKTCEIIGDYLSQSGFIPVVMHGSRTQEQRETAIRELKTGRADILVATDVAGRGIDIPNVSLVVNYQMTKGIEEYTHRIGRTGRAGKKGTAITFWNEETDKDVLYALKQMILRSPSSRCSEDLDKNQYANIKLEKNITN
ncbi:hypothetical protein FOA43_001768 [Brettanomyces nanus]|uniref:RNA helicase n=1 Tax=Eeniella nana TaxID=13502 RepID=A0A875S3T5_EENNA|nr:uncharacterized protein FOA43_001768 [Brettanomyces nanus]QPG74439.1 hypothetical protein FOA43_001768 [Brettanomyces nanus]